MLTPAAMSTILGEFLEELEERDATDMRSEEDWIDELQTFVTDRAELPECLAESA